MENLRVVEKAFWGPLFHDAKFVKDFVRLFINTPVPTLKLTESSVHYKLSNVYRNQDIFSKWS